MNVGQNQARPDPKLSFSEIPADAFLTSPGSGDSLVGLTHVPYVVGRIYLYVESIGIIELERFFRITVELQATLRQLRANLVSVEVGYSEVVVTDRSGLAFVLLNAKKGRLSHAQNMYGR